MTSIVEENIDKITGQLKCWGKKLDNLITNGQRAGWYAKKDCHQQLKELKSTYQEAHKKLDELKTVGHDTWEEFSESVEDIWENVEKGLKKTKPKVSVLPIAVGLAVFAGLVVAVIRSE